MQQRTPFAPLVFLLLTLVCQSIAAAILIITWPYLYSVPQALALSCVTSLITSRFLSLSLPWQVLNTVLPLAIASNLSLEIPSAVFLVLFVGTLLVYLPAFWTRVPYYPTPKAAYSIILSELPVEKEFSFLDIGSGFGDLIFFLSKQSPHGAFTGVEIGVIPFLLSSFKARLLRRKNVRFLYRSMWRTDLSDFNYVYAFLSPAPMSRVWSKVCQEMKTGSLFISNSFAAPAPASSVVPVQDSRRCSLYLYQR